MLVLLIIIFVSYVSLGLPDALLGSAWPLMYRSLETSEANAGIIMMIITAGTILACLLSNRAIKKLGTGLVAFISVMLTSAALWGFSLSDSFAMLCLLAVPLGLGAGSLDASITNFVALYYKGFSLTRGWGWQSGYQTVFIIQIILTAILFFSLPLWKRVKAQQLSNQGVKEEPPPAPILKLSQILRIRGVKYILPATAHWSRRRGCGRAAILFCTGISVPRRRPCTRHCFSSASRPGVS
jgi:MFS family permease